MKVIVGHSNMDLDCIGSIVLAKYLFPDHTPIRSRLVHPSAKSLLSLYEDRLDFSTTPDLKGQTIDHVVVVDTRSAQRISEYFGDCDISGAQFEVFDHHPADGRDIPGAIIHEGSFGANTTQLGLKLIKQGVFIAPEDATIALTGIYADTGNFTYPSVTGEDFQVASYLLERGANITLVKDFLSPLREKQQLALFHEILGSLETVLIRGHRLKICYLEMAEDYLGINAVVDQVVEIENGDLFLGFFYVASKNKLLVIGRNRTDVIDLSELMADYGGGGHAQAASATIKTDDGREFARQLIGRLEETLVPAVTARQLMNESPGILKPDTRLLDAAFFFENNTHTGAPVVDDQGRLVGLLTLRNIMNGRKADMMHAPVSAYMTRKLVTAGPEATINEIEDLIIEHNIGHLPIVEDGVLVGLVTRGYYLNYRRSDKKRKAELLTGGQD